MTGVVGNGVIIDVTIDGSILMRPLALSFSASGQALKRDKTHDSGFVFP